MTTPTLALVINAARAAKEYQDLFDDECCRYANGTLILSTSKTNVYTLNELKEAAGRLCAEYILTHSEALLESEVAGSLYENRTVK